MMVTENILPKQTDSFDTDEIDYENQPMYLPIERSYLLDMSSGLGYGDYPFADDPWGGYDNPLREECQDIRFIEHDKISLRMANGQKGIMDMKYDYFSRVNNNNSEIVVLRNYSTEDPGQHIVVC